MATPAPDPFLVHRTARAHPPPLPGGELLLAAPPAVAVLLLAELVLDKVPVVDHVNDAVQTLVRPTVGGVIFAATTAAGSCSKSSKPRLLTFPRTH